MRLDYNFHIEMPTDILLFGAIWEYNALYFFDQINEALKDDPAAELTLRINCEGGSPDYGMSMIQKVQELSEQISIKVGMACHSMALFMLVFVDTTKVEAMDLLQAVFHRAAYPEWIEGSSWFPTSIQYEMLVKANKDLEKAFRAKVNVEALEALPQFKNKDLKLKDIFSLESRIEVLLTASDLKKIGLVGKINKMIPTKAAESKAQMDAFKNCRSLEEFRMAAQTPEVKNPKPTNMTLADLKAENPALYAEIYNAGLLAGKTEGITAEKDRIEACMVFIDIDPAGVKAAIESGKPLTAKQMAEFALKSTSASQIKKIEKDSEATGDIQTPAPDAVEKTAKEKTISEFEKGVAASLKISRSPAAVAAGVA